MHLAILDKNKNIKGFSKRFIDPKESETKGQIVYFELKSNEVEVSEKRKIELEFIMGENLKVNLDGVITDDYIGVEFIEKGKVKKIKNLGEKPTGKLIKDCTPNELEDLRFKNLTAKEKTVEFEMSKSSILSRSVQVKNEAEILGESNPIKKGQDFYKSELVKLKTKYGVK